MWRFIKKLWNKSWILRLHIDWWWNSIKIILAFNSNIRSPINRLFNKKTINFCIKLFIRWNWARYWKILSYKYQKSKKKILEENIMKFILSGSLTISYWWRGYDYIDSIGDEMRFIDIFNFSSIVISLNILRS